MVTTREDWIKAGIKILEKKGIQNVKIESMAREMGVTKGSFYGYFQNRDVFLKAIIDYWADFHTSQIVNTIGELNGSLAEKLKELLYRVDDKKFDALEKSLLAWAFSDSKVEKIIMRVVKVRLDFLTNLFIESGFSGEEAINRAAMVHHYMAGCKLYRPLLPQSGNSTRHAQLSNFIKLISAPVNEHGNL